MEYVSILSCVILENDNMSYGVTEVSMSFKLAFCLFAISNIIVHVRSNWCKKIIVKKNNWHVLKYWIQRGNYKYKIKLIWHRTLYLSPERVMNNLEKYLSRKFLIQSKKTWTKESKEWRQVTKNHYKVYWNVQLMNFLYSKC